MKEFTYVIKDPLGIHARPAGLLVKEIKKHKSEVTVTKGGRSVNAERLIALMGLAVKGGDEIKVQIKGADEADAAASIRSFFEETL